MRCAVIRLRRRGLRLRESELGPPEVGDLRIGDAGDNSFRRPMVVAQLWDTSRSVAVPVGLPLFAPVVICMEGRTFSLQGIELEADERRVSEHVQVWRCRLG